MKQQIYRVIFWDHLQVSYPLNEKRTNLSVWVGKANSRLNAITKAEKKNGNLPFYLHSVETL